MNRSSDMGDCTGLAVASSDRTSPLTTGASVTAFGPPSFGQGANFVQAPVYLRHLTRSGNVDRMATYETFVCERAEVAFAVLLTT